MAPHSLLDLKSLSKDTFFHLLDSAHHISRGILPVPKSDKTVANLFYENSTRTLVSFELAAKRLGCCITTLNIASSSEAKGETFLDTLQTLGAMGTDAFVIRHSEENLVLDAQKMLPQYGFINAGNGMRAHPSQALLDALTIKQHFSKCSTLEDISVAIVGDVKHSRVANSLIDALRYLEISDIRICAPHYFQPITPYEGTCAEASLVKALDGIDVIYGLRVQKERFLASEELELDAYVREYALTVASLNNIKPEAIVMHPGPINRGIEMTSEVADGPHSKILKQVENGVYMRMAILNWILSH